MKKRFKTVVTTAMIAALTASLLTGCGSSTDDTTASAPETGEASDTAEASGGSDGDSILIAGIAPLTGSLASWGEGAINGYNLAIKEINEAGGVTIGDKTYTLESAVFADDKSDATEAISAYNNCASYDISAVIGSCSSSCTLSFVETAQDSGMLVITPYSTNATICKTGDYIFRECFSDADQGPTLAKLATEEFKAKSIAIVAAEDSDYCAGLAEAMEGALAEMSDVTYEHYGCVTTDTDYTAQISKAIEQGAEVIGVALGAVDDHEAGVGIVGGYTGGSLVKLGAGGHDDVIATLGILAEGGLKIGFLHGLHILHLGAQLLVAGHNAGVVRCVPALIIDLAGQQQNDLQIGSGLGAALLFIVAFAAAGSEGGHQHYSGQNESDNLFHVNPPLNFHTGF